MPPLTLMIKPVSGLCDMRCKYCFYREDVSRREAPMPGPMTEKTLENLVLRAIRGAQGTLTLIFQGGEPTLAGKDYFRKLLALERRYARKGLEIRHVIQTNGLTLDKQWCDIFREDGFLVGVSMDGTIALHDTYRHDANGGATASRVAASLALLRREGIPYNVLCVITEEMTGQSVR